MALELRPNCELCDRDLPADAAEARICSYECTYCARCVAEVLENVCPNCGGGFAPRPVRPRREWRPGLSLAKRPASAIRAKVAYGTADIQAFARELRNIPPAER